ncbi:PH domain-containing protein [Sanguibacter gelidistatuariae]|nr:PH domain-containing protein [Sanguibacter gelidistatuariae]
MTEESASYPPLSASAPTTSPFEPEGIVWQGVSARLATARFIMLGIFFGIPLVTLVVLAVALPPAAPWLWIAAAVVVVVTAWIAVIIKRQVHAIGFAERDEDLLIRKGVMFRSLVVVPYGRMQFVDVTAGPLARKLGISSLQLHTASPGTDATIDGLVPSEAARLRDRLASRGEARLAGL